MVEMAVRAVIEKLQVKWRIEWINITPRLLFAVIYVSNLYKVPEITSGRL